MKRCMNCMKEFDQKLDKCPYCNTDYILEPDNFKHICPGTVLNDRYMIGNAIDVNSIFVTYSAWDNDEDKKVYIDEFLPNNFASRNRGESDVITKSGDAEDKYYAGLKAFADECSDLADIDCTDIIGGFDANNTYYAVRRVVKGTSLAEIIDDDYEITNEYSRRVIVAVLKALAPIHNLGIIHGNITPDTVIIDENSSIVLTDFSFCGYMARIMPIYTNEGYSPVEQYMAGAKLTTAVDIYSVGAIFYELVTGEIPVTATSRNKQDTLTPISEVNGVTLKPSVCNAVMNALNIKAENRTADVESFFDEIKSKDTKRNWERTTRTESTKNDFYKDRKFWLKTLIYIIVSAMLISCAVIAYEVIAIKKDVDKEKEREIELSTEALPDEGKSIFDIFGDNAREETEETEVTEVTTEKIDSNDDVESGSGILAVFN